jgi:uncharacterized repeat protein (TIGR01451 family)
MSRGAAMGVLALLLVGALPAWGQQWKGERLCAPQPLPSGAEFGSAVAVADDGTIAVGDYRHDVVYLFDRDNCEPSDTIHSPDGAAWFGFSLAFDGKVLLVGAPKSGGTGAAYRVAVQDGLAGAPQRISILTPQPVPGDEVGSSVAISGDNLAIGARGADGRRGRVYVGSGNSFTAVQVDGLAPNTELGQSVALSGNTLVMGAPSPFRGGGSPGAAWVLEIGSDTPVPLTPSGGLEPEAAFGYAVAVDGDRILVGAPLANGAGMDDTGAVYDFRREGEGWGQGTKLNLPSHPGDQLGVAVALDEDEEVAVVGARYVANQRGEAYLKTNDLLQPLEQVVPVVQGVRVPARAQFGASVAVRGDTVVVGAFREEDAGAAYLFYPEVAVSLVVDKEVEEEKTEISVSLRTRNGEPAPHDIMFRLQTSAGTAEERLTQDAAGDYDYLRLDHDVTLHEDDVEVKTEIKIQLYPDNVCEQPETFQVILSDTAGKRIQAVQVTILDDDSTGGLEISPAQLNTSEGGTTETLRVRLTCPPESDVTFSLSTSDPTAGIVSPDQLTFTNQTWATDQDVQVVGQDDALCNGDQTYSVVIQAISSTEDPRYKGLSRSIPAENADDELACLSADKTICIDGGGTVVYTISLLNSVSGVPDAPAEFRDILPGGVSVVTASTDRGTATADPVAGSVRWTVPVPAGGEAATITIVAALDDPPGPALGNQAEATYDRDSRDHRETVQIVFSAEDVVPCPP